MRKIISPLCLSVAVAMACGTISLKPAQAREEQMSFEKCLSVLNEESAKTETISIPVVATPDTRVVRICTDGDSYLMQCDRRHSSGRLVVIRSTCQ